MKTRKVVLLEEAIIDLEAGETFYQRVETGVGDYFLESLFSDLESLRFYAGIHRKQHGFFRFLSRRFPFGIYYELEDDVVRVVAVLDMRRNPESIRKTISRR